MTDARRVVITGLGPATPIGIGAATFWDALIQRRCGIVPIDAFDTSTLPSRVGGVIRDCKAADFVPKTYRKSVKLMARDIELAVAAAYEAVKDAGLPTKCLVDRGECPPGSLDPTRFGANIGAGLICPDLNELATAFATAADGDGRFDLTKWGAEGMQNLTPLWLLKFLPNMLACHVTIVHDAQSFSNTITCGEASSHLAIGEAFRNISRGAMDTCICGGAESKIHLMAIARSALMNRLARNGDADPAKVCKPFGRNRSGSVVSEGAGLVILESLDHAKRRGARIYGEIAGFGAAANTWSWFEPDDGSALALAITKALDDASVSPTQIDAVAAFGLGTVEHDAAELHAWNMALGDHARNLPAIAIKGALGNNGAGSGAIDFCAAVLALYHNTVPPSLNVEPSDDECRFRFAIDDPFDRRLDTVVTAAYALAGGQTAALVIKKFAE